MTSASQPPNCLVGGGGWCGARIHLREWVIGWLWLALEASVWMGLAGLMALDLVGTWAWE